MEFDMPSCGGCRTCEMACSYHHRGEFAPALSSLKIQEKAEGPGYLVLLKKTADETGPACDGCRGLKTPLCVDYCREAEDLKEILREFEVAVTSPDKEPPIARHQGVQDEPSR
jgi:Fe-S-cluster-containing dehydrogenase component